ncbi:MAG: 50S ribosomal protein L11 methyltransferase [Salinivirgaceae bacterium]
MNYIEVAFSFEPAIPENREIIAALLSEVDFESFSDTKNGVNGYIQESIFSEETMKAVLVPLYHSFENLEYLITAIPDQNWNEQWEKNFEPIKIDNQCYIRAPFHSKDSHFAYEKIIEPKMSFGTGHHATTVLMIKMILSLDLQGKRVLDMGCGTGVLGILASMKKAYWVIGIDVDSWAYENSLENAQRNKISNFEIKIGNASLLEQETFDVILANINRNILLQDMELYVNTMKIGSQLVMSGFYLNDLTIITEKAKQLGLTYQNHIENEQWVAVRFSKNT